MPYMDHTIKDFTAALASKAPVPGGGGASALVGALGIALGNMVGNLTVGKKKYAEVEDELRALMGEAERLQNELLSLIDEDAAAFEPLSRAYGIPKDDPNRSETMEACLRAAAQPPLNIMRLACRAIELHREFAEKGSDLAISDAGTGVVFCWAALYGAALNVRVNTKSMADRNYAKALNAEVQALMDKHWKIAEAVYEDVYGRME